MLFPVVSLRLFGCITKPAQWLDVVDRVVPSHADGYDMVSLQGAGSAASDATVVEFLFKQIPLLVAMSAKLGAGFT